jgi:hypothetical protein
MFCSKVIHLPSVTVGLRDQWISCHSRIKNNEDKCYCKTNENIHVYRLQRNVDTLSFAGQTVQSSVQMDEKQAKKQLLS